MQQQTTGAASSLPKLRTERLMGKTFVSPGPVFFVIGVIMAVSLILIPFQTFVLNIGIWINARKKMATVKAEAKERFQRFIGAEAEHMDVAAGSIGTHVRQISGTGIAYAQGRLYVMDDLEHRGVEQPGGAVRPRT